MKVLHRQNPNLLEFLDDHIDPGQGSHKVAMIKKIVQIFACVRVREYCKQYNDNVLNKMIRRKLTKTILFSGQ